MRLQEGDSAVERQAFRELPMTWIRASRKGFGRLGSLRSVVVGDDIVA